MKYTLILLSSALLSSCSGTPNNPPYSDASRCEALLQEAEELKGKPQRRATVMHEYEQTCVNQY